MKKYFKLKPPVILLTVICSSLGQAEQAPCVFNTQKNCALFRDVLNDISPEGLPYYAATNYDHREQGGEISVFDSSLVSTYSDTANVAGQLVLTANRVNPSLFKSGQIMTRQNLNAPPYNAPVASIPFTTKEIKHGYIEIVVKLPKCDNSDDGLCQTNTAPDTYTKGLYPYVWLLPTSDANWPHNGEIDILEGYKHLYNLNQTQSTLHFNGTSGDCDSSDCVSKTHGYLYAPSVTPGKISDNFHTWGFEWEPDPNSTKGGVLLTQYFDNVKMWGPDRTDYLTSDGPKALSRGFNDPLGGYYLVAGLAVGSSYVDLPNSHLQSASMKIQSIKAYSVNGASVADPAPAPNCFPPRNITYHLSKDKKTVTFGLDPSSNTGDPVLGYELYNYQRVSVWEGEVNDVIATDTSIANVPGPGQYPYYFSSKCTTGTSYKYYRKTVTVP